MLGYGWAVRGRCGGGGGGGGVEGQVVGGGGGWREGQVVGGGVEVAKEGISRGAGEAVVGGGNYRRDGRGMVGLRRTNKTEGEEK